METNRNPGAVVLHKQYGSEKFALVLDIVGYIAGIVCLILFAPLGLLILLAAVIASFSLKKHWSDYFTIYENALDFNGRWIYFEDVESTQIWRKDETDAEGKGSVYYYIEVFLKNGRRVTLEDKPEVSDEFKRRGLMLPGIRDIK